MTPTHYRQKAIEEFRKCFHTEDGAAKKPSNFYRDVTRLASRFQRMVGWRKALPEIAMIWAASFRETAKEYRHKAKKGRPLGTVSYRENRLADRAVIEEYEASKAVFGDDALVAQMAPDPHKVGLTDFRKRVVERAEKLAAAENYKLDHKRLIDEIRNRLQGPQPQWNFLASRRAWRARAKTRARPTK